MRKKRKHVTYTTKVAFVSNFFLVVHVNLPCKSFSSLELEPKSGYLVLTNYFRGILKNFVKFLSASFLKF